MDVLHITDFTRHEIRIGRFSAFLFVFLVVFFLFPRDTSCEFYKYVDKDGKTHFVDSKTKIPREYRKDLTTYEEKYDHLSEAERQEKIAEDRMAVEQERKEKEERRRQQAMQLEDQRRSERLAEEEQYEAQREARREDENRQKAQAEKEKFLRNFETRIEVVGYGHVLVPCTLVYKDREVDVKLLLDTGCTITQLHDDVAKKLRLKTIQKYKTRISGGGTNKNKLSKLSYFKVGPYNLADFYVGVVKFKGKKSQEDGLLGMNFLAGREYKIDYVNRVIRWVP
jgi:predicted aspartyl protease